MTDDKRLLTITPPKPVSEMTAAERERLANEIFQRTAGKLQPELAERDERVIVANVSGCPNSIGAVVKTPNR